MSSAVAVAGGAQHSDPLGDPMLAGVQGAAPSPLPLIVHITAPGPNSKLRQGQTTRVQVQVLPNTSPLQRWRLYLVSDQGNEQPLAAGTEPVDDQVIATLSADAMERGVPYALILEGTDDQGRIIGDFTEILVPDPLYALIPLEPGNNSAAYRAGMSTDSSGSLLAMGGVNFGDFELIDTRTGTHRIVYIPLEASNAFHFSGNGQRIVFAGGGARPPLKSFVLGFFDIATETITQGPGPLSMFLSTDWTGTLVAFQQVVDLTPDDDRYNPTTQFALYDQQTDNTRLITTDPAAVNIYGVCPHGFGLTPLISGDGRTIAFASSATLGLAPSDGCHVFAYDVASATLRHVVRIAYNSFDLPSISYDGHWLAYGSSPADRHSEGALLDLTTGELTDPIAGIVDYPTFDAVITGDGASLVLSTQGDLDPQVGNADHNMELFLYDRAGGGFTQITETTGGIGADAGGCPPYEPRVSFDGSALAFAGVVVGDLDSCHIDASQRAEADGLVFRRVRAVRRRPGNHPPVLEPLEDARIVVGQPLVIPFAASDADGDPITFFAQVVNGNDVPPGAEVEDHHDGTATLRWQPTLDQRGSYRVRFAAFDEGGGETWQDLTIDACSAIVTDDDTVPGVIHGLFDPDPAACHAADVNHDGVISAADLVAALQAG